MIKLWTLTCHEFKSIVKSPGIKRALTGLMPSLPKFIFFLKIFLFLCLSRAASAQLCQKVLLPGANTHATSEDLVTSRNLEVKNLSSGAVAKHNKKSLEDLEKYIPSKTPGRAQTIGFRQAWDLLDSAEKHPVLNPPNANKYERPNVDIGYCFGRAMYFHLALLRMGLQKDSIRKIWIVGPMRSANDPKLIWGFHVATIAYTKEKGWVTLDTNEIKPEPVRDWVKVYSDRSIDKKPRIYVTDPSRQSVDIAIYDRIQLGLNLTPENDWFQGYFQDLLLSMKTMSLKELGLSELDRTL